MSELEKSLTSWVNIDKRISLLNNDIKILKDKREQLSESLTVALKENDMENKKFEFPHLERRVVFADKTSQEGITYKYLQECFDGYFNDPQKSEELMNIIKKNRKKITKSVLRGEGL
jgi:hypothetical protein